MKSSTKQILKCPEYLSDQAKTEWERVMKIYKNLDSDLLTDLDETTLVIYCEAWSVYRKAQETWAKYTQVVAANPAAQKVLDKCISLMEKQAKIINYVTEQLCLTPTGRSKMGL